MQPIRTHLWNVSIPEAIALQNSLAEHVDASDQLGPIRRIAGVDVAYDKDSDTIIAAVVILDARDNALIETYLAAGKSEFPYQPGLFAFREVPILIEAFRQLSSPPDLIVCDGQGMAHPRRFGLACHIGVLYDIPTIGCAKTILLGSFEPPIAKRGAMSVIMDDGDAIGMALRTQDGVNPVFVSTGHKISLETACDWVLRLAPRYRLPETTRQADHAVKMALKEIVVL